MSRIVQYLVGAVVVMVTASSSGTPTRKATSATADTAAAAGASGERTLVQIADSEPVRLVQEYVRRDGLGERLRTNPWFDSVITNPEHEPGYDGFTAIARSRVRPLGSNGDTVRVEVVYDVVGTIRQVAEGGGKTGMRFLPRGGSEVVEFPVVRTPRGWRIESPQIDQHVTPGVILSSPLIRLPEADQAKLRALAAPT